MPSVVACSLPSICERSRKTTTPLYNLYGETTMRRPPAPTTIPILTIFISYVRLGRIDMPSMVACPPPSISERSRKTTTPLYNLYGETTMRRPPATTTIPILTIFISYVRL
ncbi:hypothetical protein AVEN_16598-1 [Araneus ventricosus]|uniref:Uncharacterized protein n=1 Tax=Araneus ventricosus TaxID=182803 RepID=A0A4Y2W3J6_ARAVE|nr:hypothetical protein AVEN_16598-1 [Araneus ventricosus]